MRKGVQIIVCRPVLRFRRLIYDARHALEEVRRLRSCRQKARRVGEGRVVTRVIVALLFALETPLRLRRAIYDALRALEEVRRLRAGKEVELSVVRPYFALEHTVCRRRRKMIPWCSSGYYYVGDYGDFWEESPGFRPGVSVSG